MGPRLAELTTGLAELATKPSRSSLRIVFSALIVAYAAGIGALAVVLQLHSSARASHASTALAGVGPADYEAFDWKRYHARQDACRGLDQAQRGGAADGLAACDQTLVDLLQRQCSAFGPLGSAHAENLS